MVKIAIVDDDQRLSDRLKSEMQKFEEIESVITCDSGLKFSKDLEMMTPGKRPEVIIMDISMGIPDEGIRATRQIKMRYPDIEIIMFTISDADDKIFESFKAGAIGYLLKNESPAFILKTVLDVKSGGAQMSPAIARKTIRFLAPQHPAPTREVIEHAETLSERELEILGKVSKGLTYDQIGIDLFISANTVKKHMMNIFGKLQVKNKIEALKKTEGLY